PPPTEEQGNEPRTHPPYNPAGEDTGPFGFALRRRFPRQLQNAYAGVVVVRHFALRGLPDQLFQCRPERLRFFLDHFPLRGRWKRNPEIGFQPLQTLERYATAIAELRDHGHCAVGVLLLAGFRRNCGREHLPTTVTA